MLTPKQNAITECRETSIGTILVRMGAISEDQLQRALMYQARASIDQMLGSVMVHQGFCDPKDVDDALALQHSLRKNPVQHAMAMADMAMRRRETTPVRKTISERVANFVQSILTAD
jgi:hypothetical protein